MRTVYLGTSGFAAQVLLSLAASAHRPSLVITRPDRPRGRGRRLASPPVAAAARELGIALDQPSSVNDAPARARIAEAHPEVVCVCAFGALIKEPLLSDYELLNVHPSLLPRWRGAAPIERAIIAGDERTGVSIMRLAGGLDNGPVCLAAPEPIRDEDTYGTLAARLQRIGGKLLVDALDHRPPFRDQEEAAATYADKIAAGDRVLHPERSAAELERVVRALAPHIGAAVLRSDGDRLGVWQARARPATAADPVSGELSLEGRLPRLGCTPGVLELEIVQPPGGRAMAGDAFLRGQRPRD